MELRGWGAVLFVLQALVAMACGVVIAFVAAFQVGFAYAMTRWGGPVTTMSAAERRDSTAASDYGFLLGFNGSLLAQLVLTCIVVQGYRALRARRDVGVTYHDPRFGGIVLDYVFASTLLEAIGLGLWCVACPHPHLPGVPGGLVGLSVLGAAAAVGLATRVKHWSRGPLVAQAALALIGGASLAAVFGSTDLVWRLSLAGSVLALALSLRRSGPPRVALIAAPPTK